MKEKEAVLVSACLLGFCCRYDGKEKHYPDIDNIFEICHPVPICPEQLGGLATPRPPAERTGDRVMTENGADVTEAYEKGAKEAVKAADLYGCRFALLKEKSPSCGSGKIYDGTFTRTLREGDGTAARLLKAKGIRVYGESQTEALIKEITALLNCYKLSQQKENDQ